MEVPYSHSCSFVALSQGSKDYLAYCNCQDKDIEWYPSVPSSHRGAGIVNFNDEFDKYEVLKVFFVRRTPVDEARIKRITKEMKEVITCIKCYDSEAYAAVMASVIKKRKKKSW